MDAMEAADYLHRYFSLVTRSCSVENFRAGQEDPVEPNAICGYCDTKYTGPDRYALVDQCYDRHFEYFKNTRG